MLQHLTVRPLRPPLRGAWHILQMRSCALVLGWDPLVRAQCFVPSLPADIGAYFLGEVV